MRTIDFYRELLSLMEKRDYAGAVSLLLSLSDEERANLREALGEAGLNPDELITSIVYNYLASTKPDVEEGLKAISLAPPAMREQLKQALFVVLGADTKNMDELRELALKIFGMVPSDIEEAYKAVQVARLVDEGKYDEAYNRLNELSEEWRDPVAHYLVQRMLDSALALTDNPEQMREALGRVAEYAEKLGIKDVAETARRVLGMFKSMESFTGEFTRSLAESVSLAVSEAIRLALEKKDVSMIDRLLKEIPDALKEMKINGIPVYDILESLKTYITEIEPTIKKLSELVTDVSEKLNRYVEAALRNPGEVRVTDYITRDEIKKLEDTFNKLADILKEKGYTLDILHKAFNQEQLKTDNMVNLLKVAGGYLYTIKSFLAVDAGNADKAVDYARKAAELYPELSEVATTVTLYGMVARGKIDPETIECLITLYTPVAEGIMVEGRKRFYIR